ncbi:MAG: alpha/beta hydrolase [Bacteroidota bacterium]|nr:alpha/beta hydrolase [Candidatus Kapabacteria bacterium]MDW8220852.1 alpha/beta hydrolase [Bacteroidota bacterium]
MTHYMKALRSFSVAYSGVLSMLVVCTSEHHAISQVQEIPVLPGIKAQRITTHRIGTRVLLSGEEQGIPVVFLHGNLSSATWWEETMLALPKGFRGIAPDLRGFGGADTSKYVDARRGAGDWADDVIALLDHLNIPKAHIVGHSLGGYVVWRVMADYPERLLSVTLVAPGSPFGFGGTKDTNGTPCYSDFAGTGSGLANALLIDAIRRHDRSLHSPFTPRAALRNVIVKPPYIPVREEEFLSSMMSVHLGEKALPGDAVPSKNWTGFAPGVWGAVNALSPKYAGDMAERLVRAVPKVPVLWIRGADDIAVSNNAASDIGTLGARGIIPNYPGSDVFPPQPMIDQTRTVLERYKRAGGSYIEVVLKNCGHTPYLEQPKEFNSIFHMHIRSATK